MARSWNGGEWLFITLNRKAYSRSLRTESDISFTMQASLLCTGHPSKLCGAHPRLLFLGKSKLMACATAGKNHTLRRQFLSCTTRKQANSSTSSLDSSIQGSKVTQDNFVYRGPLTKPFRNLKIFSLSSIGLTVSLSPVLFVIDSGLPMTARISLASIALGTSSLSTALIAFCAKPYVTSMRRFRPDRTGSAEVIEMTTQSLFLKPLVTTVSDSPIPWDSVL